jgi:hypothetical protein
MSYLLVSLQDSDPEAPYRGKLPFHYNNATAVEVLSLSLRNGGIDRWKQCAEEAMNCCNNMEQKDLIPGIEFEICFRK